MQYGRRNIVDGSKYNRFFGKPEETRKVVGDNSTEYNVSKLLPKWVAQCNWQTRKIADYLWDSNLEKFCHNIWKFLFSHIQYEYDDTGREQFRSPYRSWADRERGIDCDCFSIFVSCILTNKGIPHYFRITKYNGRDQWQHIYVIVPKRGVKFDPYDGDTYYTIDCVIHEFDTEKDFSDQKLQPMNGLGIITETLAGIDDTDAAQVLTGLILDGDEMSGDKDMIKLQLIATRNWVSENPKLYEVQNGKKADDFIKMCDYALQYWDNPQKREQALSVLEENERMQEAAIKGLGTPQLRKQVFTKRIALVKAMPMKKLAARPAVEFDEDDDFDGLGKSKAEKKAAKQQKKEAKKAQKAEKKAIKKQAKAEAKQERKEKREANKEELKNQQGFWNKMKTAVKQGAKAVFVDANPAVIAIRGAFLLVVKLNLFGIAKKLHPAYCDEATAKKMGYTAKQIDVAKAAVARVFKDKRILDLFDKVIDRHSEGLAIGVYPSQYIANLVLSDVDHYAKEQLRLKWYFRYMDDIVCFVPTKEDAHRVLADLKGRIEALNLEVKDSARIAPFSYGIDFIGYKFYPTHTMLRKRIKLHMKRKSAKIDRRDGDDATWLNGMAAFWGWCKIADCKHLWKSLKKQRIMEYKRLSEIKTAEFGVGLPKEKRISINDLIGKEIIFFEYKKEMIKGDEKVVVKFAFPETETEYHYFITKSEPVMDRLCRNEANLPFIATIKKKDKYTYFE